MDHNSFAKDDILVNKDSSTAHNPFLEAVRLIMYACSHKEGKEELLSQLKNKLSSDFDLAHEKDENKLLQEFCYKANKNICEGKENSLKSNMPSLMEVDETKAPRKREDSSKDDKLQAAMLCAQALNRSTVDEKARLFTLGKIFEGLVNSQMDEQPQNLRELVQMTKGQDGNLGHSFHKEIAREKVHKELSGKLTNESYEKLFPFLNNAYAQGILELKDFAMILNGLRERNMEKMKETSDLQNAIPDHLHAISGRLELAETTGNREKDKDPNVEDELQGPLDNDHPVIALDPAPNATAVTRKKFLSFVPEDLGKERCPCLHVTQALPRPSHIADEKDKGETPTTFLPPKNDVSFSDFSKNSELKNKLHVTASNAPLSFLEVAKQCMKGSSCNSLNNVRNDENKNGNSKLTSSDESPIFKIEKEIFLERMEMCKFSVVAKVNLLKGEEPWIWKKLKEKLDGLWGLKSDWRLISLGKGFFHVILTTQEELNRVWAKGILHLKPGVLRLQSWNSRFDPTKQKSTNVQVWIRMHNLPWYLWDPSVLSGIARKVGFPLRIDKATVEGSFGHFARVLVEVDISKPFKSTVLTECNGQVFEVKVVPEHLPSFCKGCFNIGHTTTDCRFRSTKPVDVRADKGSLGGERDFQADLANQANTASPSSIKSKTVKRKFERKEYVSKEENSDDGSKTKLNNAISSSKAKDIAETVTDFSAQSGMHFSCDTFSGRVVVSNQFSALETEEDIDEARTNFEDGKKDQKDEDILPSKLPQRWSDILDDEEEKEDAPMFPDMEFPVKEKPTPYHPYRDMGPHDETAPRRDISQIRKGLDEMSQIYAHLLHTPITNKKDKKLKLAFRQSKEPIGSIKR